MSRNLNKPVARKQQVLSAELLGEMIVYDCKYHRAHRLSKTMAAIWQHCDGATTVAEIAKRLRAKFGSPADEQVVWFALTKLRKARLLENELAAPELDLRTRRQLIKALGLAGGVTAISTIVVPTPAGAASCIPCGSSTPCVSTSQCCAGCVCKAGRQKCA